MLEFLSASPFVALGLAVGGLALVLLVVRTLRRRPQAPASRTAAPSASGERRAPRVPPTATADDTGASTPPTQPPAPAARPVAATATGVEPAPAAGHACEIAARGDGPTAIDAPTQAPSAEAPGVAEWPARPADEAATPPVERASPAWFDAIPTPDVVEVATHDAEPRPEAAPDVVAFAPFDAEPPAAPGADGEVAAEAIGEAPAVGAWPPFEPSIDDAAAASSPADASPDETAAPALTPLPEELAPAFALAEPVVDDVATPAAEPAPTDEGPRAGTAPAAPQHVTATPPLEAEPPVAPAPVAEPPAPTPPPPVDAGPVRLLVVDDSAVVRAKLRKVLEGGGHKVDVAKDGREALALLAAGRYALMVTDLEMPTMSGFELIASVRASAGFAALPIVAITGHDDLEPYRQRLPGLAGLFRKPWVDGDLLAHLAGVLADAPPAARSATASPAAPQPMALA